MDQFRVLIVDDEKDFLETLVRRMMKRDLNVTGVGSGEEALEILCQNEFDVVLLDVRLPGINGIETLREIKVRYPLTEVIMLTGHASTEVAIEGMELGAFDYLVKPMTIDDLLYKIQDAYEKRIIHLKKIKNLKEVG